LVRRAVSLILDHEDLKLQAGDVVSPPGTNPRKAHCLRQSLRILFVLLDGVYDEALKQVFA
jgi:uncharacterized cupin superfamily protein